MANIKAMLTSLIGRNRNMRLGVDTVKGGDPLRVVVSRHCNAKRSLANSPLNTLIRAWWID